MRKVTFTCDGCGKQVTSVGTTKLNVNLQRGKDSTEKLCFDFCSPCFLKMKKGWKNLMAGKEPVVEEIKKVPIEELAPTQVPAIEPPGPKLEDKVFLVESQTASAVLENKDVPVPKRRGRKPKPINPEDWLNRTEITYGVIKPAEKAYILKLHVEEGLTAEEISEKIHRLPKGIKRAISSAEKSGELDRLKEEFDRSEPQESETLDNRTERMRSSYIMPEKSEIIDGEKYDIGGIMALSKAGWPASEIAKEKGYDEDVVRILLERQKQSL